MTVGNYSPLSHLNGAKEGDKKNMQAEVIASMATKRACTFHEAFVETVLSLTFGNFLSMLLQQEARLIKRRPPHTELLR